MENKRKKFYMDLAHENAILNLSESERGMLLTMLLAYAKRGEIEVYPQIPHSVKVIFNVIRAQLDRQS